MYLKIVNEVDFYKLQSALNSLYSWATAWQLPISIDKCYVLNIGAENFRCNLEINNQALPNVLFACDLGITITSNLSATMHINDIVSRARKRALAIHRCFVSRDTNTLLRTLVEHNSVIWSPSTLRDIDEIESVQRKFTNDFPAFTLFHILIDLNVFISRVLNCVVLLLILSGVIRLSLGMLI